MIHTPLDRGWQLIPFPAGEKGSRSKGWPDQRLSLELCRSLRAEHDQRLLEAHQAMVQMRGAIAGMFDLFDRIRAAGYDVSTVPSALPNPMPHQLLAAAMDPLGDLARFTERLKTDGIL
jgi:hypothetical protein